MIIWEDEALILSSIKYSETSLILKVFTKYHGVQRGFVKGAKNQKKGSIYESGNFVTISYKARTDSMLGTVSIELLKPCPLIYLYDRKKFSCIVSILNLIEFCLLENEIESDLYLITVELIEKVLSKTIYWIEEYIRWEVYLLRKIGYGLELNRCIISNKSYDLIYISPKSGCAVNKDEGEKWKNKLLTLPEFLITEKNAGKDELQQG